MACQQYHTLGRITNSMVAVLFFETFYVVDSLWNESAVLTTMDITTDGFGFMLANGLLTWLPMNYSLQARFLADFPVDMSLTHTLIVIATQCVGYYIFRSANGQKDKFRRYGAAAPQNKGTSPLPSCRFRSQGNTFCIHCQLTFIYYMELLLIRLEVHGDKVGIQVADQRMVGNCSPHQLLWRLAHGPCLVIALR